MASALTQAQISGQHGLQLKPALNRCRLERIDQITEELPQMERFTVEGEFVLPDARCVE